MTLEHTDLSEAGNKFVASMTMTFDMWHDGAGYDLDALKQIPPNEMKIIETILIGHQPVDWRDIEALACIDSPAARAAVVAGLKHADSKIRQEAMRHVPQAVDPKDREQKLLNALQSDDAFGGLSQAIDEAEEFHPPAVVDALLKGALHRPNQTAVLFAALLYFIHGKSDSAFDWDHRPFFLRFDAETKGEREAVFKELCETIKVDWAKYL